MGRLRSYLLLTLVIGVLAGWASAIDSGRLFDTWGYVSDVEPDTGNTITAATLLPPTLDSAVASPSVQPGTITLSWTLPVGDPATQIRIWRASGSCAGSFSIIATVAETPASYADSGLNAGAYCYKIQGVIFNWTSSFSGTKTANIQPPVTLRDLFLSSPNTSTNNLVTSGASGNKTLSANTHPPFEFAVWSTTGNVTVPGAVNWVLTLDLDTGNPFESATITAELWLATSGCGDSSSGAGKTLLASAPATTLMADGPITLTAVAITPPLTGQLCLKITNQGGNENSGASHAAKILTAGGSKLNGPWDP